MEKPTNETNDNQNLTLDESAIISELQQAYNDTKNLKENLEYKKVKHATESAILLRKSKENE